MSEEVAKPTKQEEGSTPAAEASATVAVEASASEAPAPDLLTESNQPAEALEKAEEAGTAVAAVAPPPALPVDPAPQQAVQVEPPVATPAAAAPGLPTVEETTPAPAPAPAPAPVQATEPATEPASTNDETSASVPTAVATTATTTTTTTADEATAVSNPDLFPCIEQPIRLAMHCRNGYYLWGSRKGRVIARKKRSEKDEFRLNYIDGNAGIVEIVNHKFGGTLQVVVDEEGGEAAKVVCVKDTPKEEETKTNNTTTNSEQQQGNGETAAATDTTTTEEDEEFEDEPPSVRINTNSSTAQKEDRQWCFVRGAHGEGVLLKSLRTGDNLAVDASGNVILAAEEGPGICMAWDMECVTGELCFLSNARLDKRIRCDMAGLLNLTDAWKGWEVFRIMETGTHHYIKISSWMHSQWFLCSTAAGDVTCCSHADSLLEDNTRGRCSQWAIEKSPQGEGVIIRSKSHGRLLCVRDGELRTYNPHNVNNSNEEEDRTEELLAAAAQQSTTGNSAKDWWNSSVSRMNASMKKVKKRMSQTTISSSFNKGDGEEEVVIPQSETLVWQLEAAHSQTYYFLNIGDGNLKQPRSIGPFPYATSNLRQTDKIQLKRTADCCKLYLAEKEQYVSCSPEGNITLVYVHPDDDPTTEWIMEKPSYQDGGSVFRSKHYNYILSYTLSDDGEDGDEETSAAAQSPEPPAAEGHFKNPFGGKPEPVAQLMGVETVGPRAIWKLEPCMPRAVSSEKIKTFALGTSIAVGTTIAMPFALAGAGAVLGAVGAEAGVLFNAIAVTLTGAEALASVGAIGATAYIVFRPEENSLTDDHQRDDEEEGERAWSKRPFSNWRNW